MSVFMALPLYGRTDVDVLTLFSVVCKRYWLNVWGKDGHELRLWSVTLVFSNVCAQC